MAISLIVSNPRFVGPDHRSILSMVINRWVDAGSSSTW
jgi:hypothetical protein